MNEKINYFCAKTKHEFSHALLRMLRQGVVFLLLNWYRVRFYVFCKSVFLVLYLCFFQPDQVKNWHMTTSYHQKHVHSFLSFFLSFFLFFSFFLFVFLLFLFHVNIKQDGKKFDRFYSFVDDSSTRQMWSKLKNWKLLSKQFFSSSHHHPHIPFLQFLFLFILSNICVKARSVLFENKQWIITQGFTNNIIILSFENLFLYYQFKKEFLRKVAWPSGLRRWFKAPVSAEAWVQIPPLPNIFYFIDFLN